VVLERVFKARSVFQFCFSYVCVDALVPPSEVSSFCFCPSPVMSDMMINAGFALCPLFICQCSSRVFKCSISIFFSWIFVVLLPTSFQKKPTLLFPPRVFFCLNASVPSLVCFPFLVSSHNEAVTLFET